MVAGFETLNVKPAVKAAVKAVSERVSKRYGRRVPHHSVVAMAMMHYAKGLNLAHLVADIDQEEYDRLLDSEA